MMVLVGLSDHLLSFGSTKTSHPLEVGIGPVVCRLDRIWSVTSIQHILLTTTGLLFFLTIPHLTWVLSDLLRMLNALSRIISLTHHIV